jgi:hypothetical protein
VEQSRIAKIKREECVGTVERIQDSIKHKYNENVDCFEIVIPEWMNMVMDSFAYKRSVTLFFGDVNIADTFMKELYDLVHRVKLSKFDTSGLNEGGYHEDVLEDS